MLEDNAPSATSAYDVSSAYDVIHTRLNSFLYSIYWQQHEPDSSGGDVGDLSWEQFYEYCQQPAWDRQNRVRVQLRCAELDGTRVRWMGTVDSVEIASVRNRRADWLDAWLPAAWAEWVACTLGQRTAQPPVPCTDGDGDAACNILVGRRRCHLNHWATFEYELVVRMTAAASGLLRRPAVAVVVVRAGHAFGNFTQQLNVSDRVWFRGVLRNSGQVATGARTSPGVEERWSMTLGKRRPHVQLVAIGCVECPQAPGLEPVATLEEAQAAADGGGELRVNGRVRDLYRGVKYLLNVLFNPLVTFK